MNWPSAEDKARWAKETEIAEENGRLIRFVKDLGYSCHSDFNRRECASWHEVSDDSGTICQIDTDVPILALKQDFAQWLDGKEGTSASDYEVRGDIHSEAMRRFMRKFVRCKP